MRQAVLVKAGFPAQVATIFGRPMVSAEFAYSPLGALAAIALASLIGCALYAFVLWPVDTLGWIAFAVFARYVGRGPIASLFK